METLDYKMQKLLTDIYDKLGTKYEISIGAPDYEQSQIDYLDEQNLLKSISAGTLDRWGCIVRKTYLGEKYVENLRNTLHYRICQFIERGEEIEIKEKHDEMGIIIISGPLYNTWMDEINMFAERYLKKHPLYNSMHTTYLHRKNMHSYSDMMGHLNALSKDDELEANNKTREEQISMSNKVFIVHGHDELAVQKMARTLEKWGFEAIILHEQADLGQTIIEKIETYTDVDFAVVLYTECDYGRAKEDDISKEKFRARQNVVFEHGYLLGRLGRERVCALVKGNVEIPGDISGVVYISMDTNEAWKMALAKNMKAVGRNIDMNKFLE